MQLAAALDGAPSPIGATTLDPYGQLVKMLLPRAQSIAIYDRMGLPVWLNDGLDCPELHRILQDALSEDLGASGTGEGFAEPIDRDHSAYVFLLRDSDARLIGVVGIVCRESRQGSDPRPFELVQGLLRPVVREEVIGHCEVRQVFNLSREGQIAGAYVTDGRLERSGLVRLFRDNVLVHTGAIGTLKRFKDDVSQVQSGYECGLRLANFNDVKQGDLIEAFVKVEEAAKLERAGQRA